MADHSFHPENLREAFAASLDWWADAGVLEHVEDAPSGWLKEADDKGDAQAAQSDRATDAPSAPPPPPPPPPNRTALSRFIASGSDGAAHPGDPAQWPDDLDAFRAWWMESDALDPPGSYPRVAPRGPAQAQVMLLVDQPAGEDLLGEPAAILAANMLRAMGYASDAAYFASVLPRHTLRPEWDAVGRAGYGKLAQHHVALVHPAQVIVLGERVWSLLAHEMAQEDKALTTISHGGGKAPVFAMPDFANLLRSPAKRAQTWTRWLNRSAPAQ
ncbi:hypothetical protein [Alteriqipengyuania lutimaris]|uniref:hypothetical protein n=1 Tax=Alteriqipengyuania lutimaris TaxID=1538146 RepID=UPI001CFC4C7D|nr:hypothetical protein [Alteriqipengyuania lutimaris]